METENMELVNTSQPNEPAEEGLLFVETARFTDSESKMFMGRNQDDVVFGAAVGAGSVGLVAILALLRERKIKNSLLRLVDDIGHALLVEIDTTHDHAINPIQLCHGIIERIAMQKVRSIKNPFGLSRKESGHLITALQHIGYSYSEILIRESAVAVANPEDIEATVTPENLQEEIPTKGAN